MKNELVVKDNALINASYNLEVSEQRLIFLAIINARETKKGITSDSKLEIHASDYANRFHVGNDAAYLALKNAVSNLFDRQFSFREKDKNGNIGIVRSRWVSRIKYIDDSATLEITFAPDVVPLITRLEEHFTSYQLKQVAPLTSKYAIRLYELLIAWREVGKMPQIDLEEFRQQIGIEASEYTAMNNFKSRVLEPAIKQINEHTDITASYEQHKKGRNIVGFSFKFKQKKNTKKESNNFDRDPTTEDMFCNMTDIQIDTFGDQLSRLHELSHLANVGENYQDLAMRIKDMLKDPEQQKQFHPYLKQLGFRLAFKEND